MDVLAGGVAAQGEHGVVFQDQHLVGLVAGGHVGCHGLLHAQAGRVQDVVEPPELGGSGGGEADFAHGVPGGRLEGVCK